MNDKPRLQFLDALRGLAATAVFVEHGAARAWPAFREFHTQYFQVGQFGVSLFFICSGFVIPYTLERKSSLKRFWISRFFRLYPLYWASLGAALILASAGVFALPENYLQAQTLSSVMNLTMLQQWVGYPHAVSTYWSLGFEMVFYFIVSLLLVLKLNRQTFMAVVVLFSLSILNPAIVTGLLGKRASLGLVFHFATMFYGTAVYRFYHGEMKRSQFDGLTAFALVAIVGCNFLGLYGKDDPAFAGVRSFLPMTLAWIAAFATFLAGYALRNRPAPKVLVGLGLISYSLYLSHAMVVEAVPLIGSPLVAFLVWFAISVAISMATYRWIELPAVAAGRRTASRLNRSVLERQTVAN